MGSTRAVFRFLRSIFSSAPNRAATSDQSSTDEAWGDRITSEREIQLRDAFVDPETNQQLARLGARPVALSGADLYWLTQTVRSSEGTAPLNLAEARLVQAHLHAAKLFSIRFAGARLDAADLSAADLTNADLSGATLQRADLRGTFLTNTDLKRADLRLAQFNEESQLQGAKLDRAFLEGVIFGGVDLSVVEWETVRRLGDEIAAVGAEGHRAASRAYRTLSLNLHSQGVTGVASRFHFRAEIMWRGFLFAKAREGLHEWLSDVTRLDRVATASGYFLMGVGSWILGVFAGYGVYHLWRLFVTYFLVIMICAAAFTALAPAPHSTGQFLDLLVLSVTSFHGRGLQPHVRDLNEAVRSWAAAEAVLGLVIEALFIAAFTRRVLRI